MDTTLLGKKKKKEKDAKIKYHDSKTEAENILCNAFSLPSMCIRNFSFEMEIFLKIFQFKK